MGWWGGAGRCDRVIKPVGSYKQVFTACHELTLCHHDTQQHNTYHADSSSQTFSGYNPCERKIKVRNV